MARRFEPKDRRQQAARGRAPSKLKKLESTGPRRSAGRGEKKSGGIDKLDIGLGITFLVGIPVYRDVELAERHSFSRKIHFHHMTGASAI